ncbi:unnamed protein product, partial [Coregonus sp. 'balchen']
MENWFARTTMLSTCAHPFPSSGRYLTTPTLQGEQRTELVIKQELRFTEALTSADKVTREKLWPSGGCSSKGRETVFFVGARMIVDGKEMRPNQNI